VKVELVSYTKTCKKLEDENIKTPEDLIAYCARVSNPSNQFNNETAKKLIRYLIKNQHWSPLEMVDVTVEINTTRDIGRQILRHWSFSFQEFSQRYADPTDMVFELREARLQDAKNRQSSVETENIILQDEWFERQKAVVKLARETYRWAIEHGIAKEQARVVLPEGMTQTRMYMKGSIRDWIFYISLRTGNGTQKEHKLIAREIARVIAEVFPMSEEFIQVQGEIMDKEGIQR